MDIFFEKFKCISNVNKNEGTTFIDYIFIKTTKNISIILLCKAVVADVKIVVADIILLDSVLIFTVLVIVEPVRCKTHPSKRETHSRKTYDNNHFWGSNI